MTPQLFKERLDAMKYDKYCQDIEYIDFIGHTKSHITWALIKDMFDWKGKKVVDLGCFHGYYCFKVEQEGGIVTGFDRAPMILRTASVLRDAYNSKVIFQEWSAGEVVPKMYDIALLMIMSYNLPNRRELLENIKCRYVLFEVTTHELPLIYEYYNIIKEKKSPKITPEGEWYLLLGERKDYVA